MLSQDQDSKSNLNCKESTSSTIQSETQYQNQTFHKGPFKFLLSRTEHEYQRPITNRRRTILSEQSGSPFPQLTDSILESLYNHTVLQYKKKCLSKYKDTGFGFNQKELLFLDSFNRLKESLPILRGVEIYPVRDSVRMAIGPYLPDFLIFGLAQKGSSLLSIEVNGSIHLQQDKVDKDIEKASNLRKLDIGTIDIDNQDVSNLDFLKKLFNDPTIINISNRPKQLQIVLRKVWIKTIVNHNSLEEIEKFILENFQVESNLIKEFNLLSKLKDCPRDLKKEYKMWRKS